MSTLKIDQQFIESSDESVELLPKIYKELVDLSQFYPGFQGWYENKVVPGLLNGERTLLLELRSGNIAGLAILKNDGLEKKLCCLRVFSEYQKKMGIGYKLFERSMDELETRYPLLSVGEEKIEEFNKIFTYFGFKKSWEYPDLYRPRKLEISYNGILLPYKRNNVKYLPFGAQPTNTSFKLSPIFG